MNASAPQIRAFEEPTGPFRQQVKRLPSRMKRELAKAIDELLAGTPPPGRRYEKLRTGRNLHSVRLNRNYRFVFLVLENGNAVPVAVGPHNEAYRVV